MHLSVSHSANGELKSLASTNGGSVTYETHQVSYEDSNGVALLGLLAALNAVNQHMKKPILSDPVGLITGAVVAAVATIIWQVVRHVADRRPGATPH